MDLLEREMAQDMLLMEKQLTQSYTTAETECANEGLRKTLHRLHEDTESMHARLFQAMHQRGWYQTPVAGQQAIETAILSWEQKELRGERRETPR
ncbi:MAG: hypothetical protein CW342_10245 [Thermoactinomycetaceae bacterium]|nr:hypothetical protein [Thermoactinomycetaceae bacterium]